METYLDPPGRASRLMPYQYFSKAMHLPIENSARVKPPRRYYAFGDRHKTGTFRGEVAVPFKPRQGACFRDYELSGGALSRGPIESEVENFIIENIQSLFQLEVLLLLHKNSRKSGPRLKWTTS